MCCLLNSTRPLSSYYTKIRDQEGNERIGRTEMINDKRFPNNKRHIV
jgi:hypothetical protein